MNNKETKVLAGITAQFDFALQYATDIVKQLVTDTTLAASVNAAITTKLTAQKNAFTVVVTKIAQNEIEEQAQKSALTKTLV